MESLFFEYFPDSISSLMEILSVLAFAAGVCLAGVGLILLIWNKRKGKGKREVFLVLLTVGALLIMRYWMKLFL